MYIYICSLELTQLKKFYVRTIQDKLNWYQMWNHSDVDLKKTNSYNFDVDFIT